MDLSVHHVNEFKKVKAYQLEKFTNIYHLTDEHSLEIQTLFEEWIRYGLLNIFKK
jgi:hypothetical protein